VTSRVTDISEDLCDQLNDQLKTARFALQANEATEVVKYAHLTIFSMLVGKMSKKKDFLLCKTIDDRATSLKYSI
jgi:hypothetical protein